MTNQTETYVRPSYYVDFFSADDKWKQLGGWSLWAENDADAIAQAKQKKAAKFRIDVIGTVRAIDTTWIANV